MERIKCLTPPVVVSPITPLAWLPSESIKEGVQRDDPDRRIQLRSPLDSELSETLQVDARLSDVAARFAVPQHAAIQDNAAHHHAATLATNASPSALPSPLIASMLMIWLVGSLATWVYFLSYRMIAWRRIRLSLETDRGAAGQLAGEVCRAVGVSDAVPVCWSRDDVGPAVLGLLKPMVILPASMRRIPEDDLRPILAHELIHVRRRDAWVLFAQHLAEIVWWFHPLVWWANRQIVSVREQCCDEETIVALGCEPEQYAQRLLDAVKWKRNQRFAEPTFELAVLDAQRALNQSKDVPKASDSDELRKTLDDTTKERERETDERLKREQRERDELVSRKEMLEMAFEKEIKRLARIGGRSAQMQFAQEELTVANDVLHKLRERVAELRTKSDPKWAGIDAMVAPNPNSGVVWHQSSAGKDAELSQTIHRTIAPPVLAEGVLVLADYSGIVHGLRAKDGKRLWSSDVMAMVYAQPLIVGDRVYIADEDGDVATLSLATGQEVGNSNAHGKIHAPPVARNDVLYIIAGTKLIAISK